MSAIWTALLGAAPALLGGIYFAVRLWKEQRANFKLEKRYLQQGQNLSDVRREFLDARSALAAADGKNGRLELALAEAKKQLDQVRLEYARTATNDDLASAIGSILRGGPGTDPGDPDPDHDPTLPVGPSPEAPAS